VKGIGLSKNSGWSKGFYFALVEERQLPLGYHSRSIPKFQTLLMVYIILNLYHPKDKRRENGLRSK